MPQARYDDREMSPFWLVPFAFLTSMLTAVLGVGGGLLLVSTMPGPLPPAAVVPIHGVVQLVSNLSRALFGWRHIAWPLVGRFALGSALGAAIGSRLVVTVPANWLPVLLALFILVVTWLPIWDRIRWPGKFFTLGAVQTFISLFVGAAGPLVTPLLLREDLSRDRLVVTHGAMMTILHSFKAFTFLLIGFSFMPYWRLLAAMVMAVILGSWAGTVVRKWVPEARFRWILKVLLTLLATRLLFSAWL